MTMEPRGVWRSGFRNGSLAGVALVFVLIGFSGIFRHTAFVGIATSDVVFAGVVGVPAGLFFLRALFLRVVVKSEGIVVHSMFRNRTILWTSIAAIECRDVSRGVIPAVAPVVELADGGGLVELVVLASYAVPGKRGERSLGRRSAAALQELLRQFGRVGPQRR